MNKSETCPRWGRDMNPDDGCGRCGYIADPDYFYGVKKAIASIPMGIKYRDLFFVYGQIIIFLFDTYLITHSLGMVVVTLSVNVVFLAYFFNAEKRDTYKLQLAFIAIEWGYFLTGGLYGASQHFTDLVAKVIYMGAYWRRA